MIFSAAKFASRSDGKSSGVTKLSTSPRATLSVRDLGVMAARQCPGLRWYVTIENLDISAKSPPRTDPAPLMMRSQRGVETKWPPTEAALLGFHRAVAERAVKVAPILGLDNLKSFGSAVHLCVPR
jgi:hypothetical protein